MFVDKSCEERWELLRDKGLCCQCLAPGTTVEHGKHKTGSCYSKFVCKHQSHDRDPRKRHVLLCEEHKDDPENIRLLEAYKEEHILKCKSVPDFSKEIKLSFHSNSYLTDIGTDEDEVTDSGIFVLQTIKVEDELLNLFYDSGCGDLVTSRDCISKLEGIGKASLIAPGPIQLTGVGDVVTVSQHGHYKISLKTCEGDVVSMRGVCLDQVTHKIPQYPLKKIEKDIRETYKLSGRDPSELPRLPAYVGGDTHLMIGSKYMKYHPVFKFQMPSGLRIFESCFESSDGSRGVIGGPHSVITEIERKLGGSFVSYFSEQLLLYTHGVKLNLDNRLFRTSRNFADIEDYQCYSTANVETVSDHNYTCVNCGSTFGSSSKSKRFEAVENAASEICRDCLDCKKMEEVQCISIQEEVEQDIDRSVSVDPEKGVTIETLPFLEDPLATLATNKNTAMSVYKAQVRKLDNNPKDRADVIESESNMLNLLFVEKLENLTEEQRRQIFDKALQCFIPWRAVWNPGSMSTPCGLVFDASQVTPSGYNLNSILDLDSPCLQNCQTLKDLVDVQFERTVVPEDAVDVGDASGELHCAAVYARSQRKDSSHSSQLIFSRSRLVPDGMSIARLELLAAHLIAIIGHIVILALSDFHKGIPIMTAWFEYWVTSHVPKSVDQPQWFNSDADVKVGDCCSEDQESLDVRLGTCREIFLIFLILLILLILDSFDYVLNQLVIHLSCGGVLDDAPRHLTLSRASQVTGDTMIGQWVQIGL